MFAVQSTEAFRPVPGFPNARVSDAGRVQKKKTPGRKSVDPNQFVWVDCRTHSAGDGYLQVRLWDGRQLCHRYVHRLVLEAFVGSCPPGMQTRHVLNNDKTDNRLVNLCWGTPVENMADKHAQGTHRCGTQMWKAKLTEADIAIMRAMRASGISRGAIADHFGITPERVSKTILGDGATWRHAAVNADERAKLKRAGLVRGEKHHKAKLTAEQVAEIRRRHKSGETGAALGRAFGVNKSAISQIIRGKTWN